MRRSLGLAAFLLVLLAVLPARAQTLAGSGSTFAFPVMSQWVEAYQKATGVRISYEPIGSPGGLIEIKSGVVDFAVSDAPLVDAQLLRDGLTQFPLLIGAIVPVVNLQGVGPGQLRLSGPLLADIYLGRVTAWNDPAIAALNPGLPLPKKSIAVVYRSDGSGTTFNWTDFLSKSSAVWKVKPGANTTIAWPLGIGAKGNKGVAEMIGRVAGAIGYVEYSYALQANLTYGLVQNRSGAFVPPTAASFQAAINDVDWSSEPDFYVVLTDPAAADAYPIMATSFALVRTYPKDIDRAKATIAFFRWALRDGGTMVRSLNYMPLPESLVQQVEAYWGREVR
jgi:phosphate transport system substrate-binding protein